MAALTLTYKGKEYPAINQEEEQVLGCIRMCSFRVYVDDMVWVTTDVTAKLFGVPLIASYDSFDTLPGFYSSEDNVRRANLYRRVVEGEEYASDCFTAANGSDSYKFSEYFPALFRHWH